MRGSPVLRFILLAIALAATAVGLQRVTSARIAGDSPPEIIGKAPARSGTTIPFRLMLSASAVAVEIDTGKVIHPDLSEMPISGVLELDAENPHVGLVVRWKVPSAAGEHRFAKLTLEPPGQETVVHVFDADGDIDDFLELPFPAVQ